MTGIIELSTTHAWPTSEVVLKGHRVTMTWMDPELLPGVDPRAVFGVSVVAFSGADEIVMVDLARGLEIPAGGVEDTDENLEATVRREAWEEARVTLGEVRLAQLVRVDWLDRAAPAVYIPVYAAEVATMPAFEQCHESRGRRLVSCQDYVDHLGFGPAHVRRALIADAKAALAPQPVR